MNCLRSLETRIVGSNPTQGMDVCLCVYSVFVLSCVEVAAMRGADHSPKESYRLFKKDFFFFALALQPEFGPLPTSMKLSVSLRFSRSYIIGRTPWAGDQLVARPLYLYTNTEKRARAHTHTHTH
jgi:hypothetical protein